nr:hypothetical protein GCM10020063_039890 [Dactylosporangium thailandense]
MITAAALPSLAAMTDLMPLWVAGAAVHGETTSELRSPYDNHLIATTSHATDDQMERAVAGAAAVRHEAAALPIHTRADALAEVGRAVAERAEEFARLITAESGKPLFWARAEVGRAISVFRTAAEATRVWSGEVMRLDTDAGAEGRLAYVRRVPKGPVLAVSPFNFPLNLVAHKVAPAIAVGAPVVESRFGLQAGSSPTTSSWRSGPTASSRSAASSSATCRPTVPIRCPTAGSRTPASDAKVRASR